MKYILALFLAALTLSASAQVTGIGPTAFRSGNAITVEYPGPSQSLAELLSRDYVALSGPANNGPTVGVSDTVRAVGPAGQLELKATRVVGAAAIARGVAAVATNPYVAGAAAIAIVLNDARIKAGTSGGLVMDSGQGPQTRAGYEYQFGNGPYKPDVNAACLAFVSAWNALVTDGRSMHCVSAWIDSGGAGFANVEIVDMSQTYSDGTHPKYGQTSWASSRPAQIKFCPDLPSPIGGGTYAPEIGKDGLCPSGVYAPVSEATVATKIQPFVSTENAAQLAKQSIDAGATLETATKTPTVTGPSKQVGKSTSTQTTQADGTKVDKVTTPTYNYTYNTNVVNISITENASTTTTKPDGTKVTEGTTSDVPDPTDSMCKQYPESLACQKMGSVDDVPITPVQKSVEVAQESINLPSGCPGDIALPGGRSISYASACDAAQKMAPLVIAAGVLSALLIALAAVRGN